MASTSGPEYSLVIPVYRNEDSLPELLQVCEELNRSLRGNLEVVFVVDGSPDRSYDFLDRSLPESSLSWQIILLSRNFGSFSAIRAGLEVAQGRFMAIMAADLQEPPSLILQFFTILGEGSVDVVIGTRTGRADPRFSRLCAGIYWWLYRRFVLPEMPSGGVDIFGCNEAFRNALLPLRESHSSLIGLAFWIGFRRQFVEYKRLRRRHGRSAWTLNRKFAYLTDSIFTFTDFPIRVLSIFGSIGLLASAILVITVLVAKASGLIKLPGYTATIITITFFAALNSFGLGVIGSYVWRTFENTKCRPDSIVLRRRKSEKKPSED